MPTTSKSPAPQFPGDAIGAFLDRYMIFAEEEQRTAVILWIIHSHAVEAAYTTPYLYITSAEKRSGKTRLLECIEALCHNPILASSITASTLYRDIESTRPTLLIDEVDAVFSGSAQEDLRNVLNSGYKSNGQVRRTVPGKDGGESKAFSTFCPKALAGIDNAQLPDTIRDRSIRLTLKRKLDAEPVERFQYRKVEEEAQAIKDAIQEWVAHNMDKLVSSEPKPIVGIGDRQWDIAEPLVAIAERGKGWGPQARKALGNLLAEEEEPLSPQALVLLAARNILRETGADRVSSATIAEVCDMSQKLVGVRLAPYGVKPGTIRFGSNTAKGYYAKDMEEAFSRYLPREEAQD